MNIWTGVGRIGRDAEVRYTPQGTAVMNFPLAVDVGFGEKKTTLWLDCAGFGKMAEGSLPQYLVKGAQVAVSGEINLRQYTKGNGEHGAAVTLRVNSLDLVGGNPQGQSQPQQRQTDPSRGQAPQGQPQRQPEPVDDFEDDIPF